MQEKATCLEAENSLDALLLRVKEMEGEVEREKEQVYLPIYLSVCHYLFISICKSDFSVHP